MAVQNPPYCLDASSHDAELFRRATGLGFNQAGGVVGLGDLAVTQDATPAMSVQVAGGEALVPGSVGSNQGSYYVLNDAAVTVTVAASDPTFNRIDLICVVVKDAEYSGSSNTVLIQAVTGTASASPAAPAAPANSLVLAQLAISAASTTVVTANITDERVFASPRSPLALRGTPCARIYDAGGTTVPSGGYTPLNIASTDFASGITAGSSQLTIVTAGKYRFAWSAGISSAGGSGGTGWEIQASLVRNGSVSREGASGTFGDSTHDPVSCGSSMVQCSIGDVFAVWARQNTGSSRTVGNSTTHTYLEAHLVSI